MFRTLTTGIAIVLAMMCCMATPTHGAEPNTEIKIDTVAAREAYAYLSDVRKNPSAYSVECKVDMTAIEPRPRLNVDPLLERVAQTRALDMATRNYFAHQDPEGNGSDVLIVREGYRLDETFVINSKSSTYESLQMAMSSRDATKLTGTKSIRQLIYDSGKPTGAHRKHVLSLGSRETYNDIGIGFVRFKCGDTYKNICVVIIAKKQ